MSRQTWNIPVHKEAHAKLASEGYYFVESKYEGEIAVSKYRNDSGNIKRVSQYGDIKSGEAKR
jgi:hypothetical protein